MYFNPPYSPLVHRVAYSGKSSLVSSSFLFTFDLFFARLESVYSLNEEVQKIYGNILAVLW